MAAREEKQIPPRAEAVVVMTTFKAGVDVTARRRNLRSAMRHLGKLPARPKTRMLPFPLSAYFAPQSA